ncbi:Ig-like domain-containing protein, partial [candidate division KSB1 bacterium]|nr:Ig-like domain-containing protein [candidate division KSB1 bacterium]
TLYLAYRDDMGTTALSKSGNISRPFQDYERPRLYKQSLAEKGEIFFTVYHNNAWSPASNLTSDLEDNRYPELPRRVLPGEVDAIWMRELSSAAYQLRHLHLNTAAPAYTTPLQISAVYPAAGAQDVPYFRQAFQVRVDFDQRVAVDSLVPAHVIVTSAARGAIDGLITYDPAGRRMTFVPDAALSPEDQITVTLQGTITNESGIGLDGNANGSAEGSPADDFTWTFRTQEPDNVAPLFTIGVLQNPVLTRYMDIFAIPSEMLSVTPTMTIGGEAVTVQLVPGQTILYKGDYRLNESGTINIQVNGVDLAGNPGNGMKDFSAQLMMAEGGGWMTSADHQLQLQVEPGALPNDGYLTIVKKQASDIDARAAEADYYQIGPASIQLLRSAQISFTGISGSEKQYYIEQQQADGRWLRLDCDQNGSGIVAYTTTLGNFRLNSETRVVPQAFALRQNYPNPFQLQVEQTMVAFELPRQERVELVIYNLLGERVRTLINSPMNAGIHTILWDGRDDGRNYVASGVYFYRFKAGRITFTRKMLLLQ